MHKSLFPVAAAALLLVSAGAAMAQPAKNAPGPQASASAPRAAGPASGPRHRMGPRHGRDFTHGWSMMSREERAEHRKRMGDARTPEECRMVRDEHRRQMEQRARERGMANLPDPRRDACAGFGK